MSSAVLRLLRFSNKLNDQLYAPNLFSMGVVIKIFSILCDKLNVSMTSDVRGCQENLYIHVQYLTIVSQLRSTELNKMSSFFLIFRIKNTKKAEMRIYCIHSIVVRWATISEIIYCCFFADVHRTFVTFFSFSCYLECFSPFFIYSLIFYFRHSTCTHKYIFHVYHESK